MPQWKSKIRIRMMLSLTSVSFAVVLLLEILCTSVVFFVIVFSPNFDATELRNTQRIAHTYSRLASDHIGPGLSLDPALTFAPNTPTTLAPIDASNPDVTNSVPYIASPYAGSQLLAFALLISPAGSVIASSNPRAYPGHVSAATLLSSRYSLVAHALKGEEEQLIGVTATGRSGQVAVPVFNQIQQVVGAVYVQLPPEVSTSTFITKFAESFLLIAIVILLFTIPVGAVLSLIFTRRQLDRMQRFVEATAQFASGHYKQRVRITNEDEFGFLERQFNLMGEQLVESIQQRNVLTEQNARLAERARLLRDLHDGVKQQAFALTMQISTVLTLMDSQPEAARVHLHNSEALAHQVQQELTALIQSSRPSVLSEKDIAKALQAYVTTWSRQQNIAVQQHIEVCALPPFMEEALLRITQEALSNIARHSHASAITLELSCKQNLVILVLEDNGNGFDPDDPALAMKEGVGLRSMRERIEAFHGTLHIESGSSKGTRIVACCPYTNLPESREEAQFAFSLLPDKEVL